MEKQEIDLSSIIVWDNSFNWDAQKIICNITWQVIELVNDEWDLSNTENYLFY